MRTHNDTKNKPTNTRVKLRKAKTFGNIATMVKESRFSGETGIGFSREETARQVTRGDYYSHSWNMTGYDYLDRVKFWRRELGPVTVELSRIHHLSGQRFIEHAEEALEDPDFDPTPYASTTLSIFREFGRIVGEGYVSSYFAVTESGISPDEYLEFTRKAAKDGGKIFAQIVTRGLGSVVKNDGNANEYLEAALKVRELLDMSNSNGRRAMKAFVRNGAVMVRSHTQEVFLTDYGELGARAIEELGTDAAYFLLKCLPQLVSVNHLNPFDFINDMITMRNEYGEKSVRQYLAGIARNTENLKDKGENAQRKLDIAKKAYQDLVDGCNQTAASFLAFRGLDIQEPNRLLENQRAIAWLKANVPSKVFGAAAWYGGRVKDLPLSELVVQIKKCFDEKGPKQTVRELQYAAGVQPYREIEFFPALHPVETMWVGQDAREVTIWGHEGKEDRFLDNKGRERVDMEKYRYYWDEVYPYDEEEVDFMLPPREKERPTSVFPEVRLTEGHQYRLPDFRTK